MADFCTCGAELPPDALFCHKCGKPQREGFLPEPEVTVREEPVEPKPEVKPAAPEIGFHNSMAVRVGFLAGSVAFLLGLLPVPFLGRIILLLGAGFFSVFLYRRRSGQSLSVGNGARIGWMSGLFCFVIITLLFTVNMLLISFVAKEGGMAGFYREQLGNMGMPEESIREVVEILGNPWRMGALLFSLFFLFTGLLTAGGALGAKMLRRN